MHVIGLVMGPYTVSIGTTPSCTCEDFMKSRMVEICKHLIWVYVVVLGVNEKDDTLQQAALTEQEVRSIFQRAPPPCTQPKPALGKKRLVSKSSTNYAQSNADRVIRNDPRSNHPQVWRLERLNRSAGPKPQCAGCKKVSFDMILVIFCWRLMLFTFHATRNFVFSARIDSVSTLRASPKCQGF